MHSSLEMNNAFPRAGVTSSQLAIRALFIRISSAYEVSIGSDQNLTCAEADHWDVHPVNRERLLRI